MVNNKNKGFILITTLIMSVILLCICIYFATIVKNDSFKSLDQGYNMIAYYTAKGGIDFIVSEMTQGKISGPSYQTPQVEIYNYNSLKGVFTVKPFPDFNSYIKIYNNPYLYLYTVESTAVIKRGDTVIAQKTLLADIATTDTVINNKVSAFVGRIYEKYR